MAKKATAEKADGNNTIITKAKKCLEKYQSLNSDNIRRAEDAIRFRAGEQWPDTVRRDRESDPDGARPCPVLDKTNQYVRQVINEERQNRASIKIQPVDDKADKKVAEVLTGIVRHIEYASNALAAYTTAGEHAIDGGFGYFRILTEYCDDESFDQDIRIKRIPNRFSVALGPHQEIDGSDAQEAVVWEDMPVDTFKAMYPKAKTDGFDSSDTWGSDDVIRVAEYFRIVNTPTTLYMVDGQVFNELPEGITPEAQRSVNRKSVKWYKLTANEVLEENDIIGTRIPVIKVTGNELVMPDGAIRLSGMIETMMDPQRLHNYAHAGFIEHVALAPRAPWVGATEAIAGKEQDYADSNRRNISVLTYNHKDESGNEIPMPQRTPPPGIAPGWQQMLQNTEHGIEASVGMYGATVGAKSQEKSGIALQEQKSQGMVGNFHFPDNLARSIQQCGRILVEWIPKVYDTERVARMLGEDDTASLAFLNPNQESPVMPRLDKMGQEIGKSYNLNLGKYDVVVSTGPTYTSKRQEAAQNQIQLLQAKPELLPLIGDIVFRNMDAPGSDKIADRIKAMHPPQIAQLEAAGEEEAQQDIKTQLIQASQQMQAKGQELGQKEQELMMLDQQIQGAAAQVQEKAQELATTEQELTSQASKLEADKKVFEATVKQRLAEIKVAEMELEAGKTGALQEINAAIQETQEPDNDEQASQPSQPAVNVIDSSVAGPLSEIAMSNQVMSQTVGQSMSQIAEIMAQVSQGLAQNSQSIAMLAAQHAKPKQAVLSDGRVIKMNTVEH